jgi:putative ABC transport system permease protein
MFRTRLRLWTTLFCREASRGLLRHKLRSGLTSLGIMAGIAGVVVAVGVGKAGTDRAKAALEDLGDNFIWIEAGSRNAAGVRSGTHGMASLVLDDAEAIRRDIPLIRHISPQIDGTLVVVHGNRNWTTRFRGETPSYLAIKKWNVAEGTPLTQDDVDYAAKKILIGQTVREHLFGAENPIGVRVRVAGQTFEVVGVLAPKGQSAADARDQDDFILMPYTTAKRRLRGAGPFWLNDILCSAVSADAVKPAMDQIVALLRERHRIGIGQGDDFNIRRPEEVLNAKLKASDTLAKLLFSVASIALLVGGIGIMNVMLASVAQRIQEIGLRLAVGATRSAVQIQFLGEAVQLSLAGGTAGIAAAVAGSSAFAHLLGWQISISAQGLVVALGASIAVGVGSGLYPALRASRLDPIDALRRES